MRLMAPNSSYVAGAQDCQVRSKVRPSPGCHYDILGDLTSSISSYSFDDWQSNRVKLPLLKLPDLLLKWWARASRDFGICVRDSAMVTWQISGDQNIHLLLSWICGCLHVVSLCCITLHPYIYNYIYNYNDNIIYIIIYIIENHSRKYLPLG